MLGGAEAQNARSEIMDDGETKATLGSLRNAYWAIILTLIFSIPGDCESECFRASTTLKVPSRVGALE